MMPASELSTRDLIGLRHRRGMHFPGGHLYVVVVAYLLGLQRAKPSLLVGFNEFVAVTHSKNAVQGWDRGVLVGEEMSPGDIARVIKGDVDADLNAKAIQFLFDALEAYEDCREKGQLEPMFERFKAMRGG